MIITIDTNHNIEDIVYLKTDTEQLARMVFGFIVYNHATLYRLTCGTQVSEHYDFEITKEKEFVLSLSSNNNDDN